MKRSVPVLLSLMLLLVFVSTANANDVKYIGAKKCKACHIKWYKAWEKTAMANSFENLKPNVKAEEKKKAGLDPAKDYTTDAKCLKCHTTGYGKPGGFKNMTETPKLVNVQCEACHGPGSNYKAVMKKNKKTWKETGYTSDELKSIGLIIPSEDEKGCLVCHGGDSPFSEKVDAKYKFNFKERLEKTHKHFPLKYKK